MNLALYYFFAFHEHLNRIKYRTKISLSAIRKLWLGSCYKL